MIFLVVFALWASVLPVIMLLAPPVDWLLRKAYAGPVGRFVSREEGGAR